MPTRETQGGLCIVSLGETPVQVEESVCSIVQFCFEITCEIVSPEPRPDFALDAIRNQYDALQLLDQIENRFPQPDKMVLATTGVDLFIPVLTFVFGEARLGGRSAIISTFRLREEFYGRRQDRAILLSRAEKAAGHEVGHMLGLTHCLDRNCVMHASNSLADTDVKSTSLCPGCHSRLPR